MKPTANAMQLDQLGNDYIQTSALYVEESYQDGIFTECTEGAITATSGYNKRIINTPQEQFETLVEGAEAFSGTTDGSAVLTKEYATAKVYDL